MFGGSDLIRPQAAQDVEVDWICVTDDPELEVPPPYRRVVEKRPGSDTWAATNLAANRFKLMPGTVTDCQRALWIDGNIEVTSPSFAREAMASVHDGIALFRHPRRSCIYEEAEASLGAESQGGKYGGMPIRQQVDHYRSSGHPEQGGLWACGVIAWDLADPRAADLGRQWMEEIERWTVQDQLSLPVVLRRLGIEPGEFSGALIEEDHIAPGYLGNRWLRIWPHVGKRTKGEGEEEERPAAPPATSLSPVDAPSTTVRSRLRRIGGKAARRGATRLGFELVRSGEDPRAENPDTIEVPLGREERFIVGDYEVVPRDRYDIVPRNYYSPVPNLETLYEGIWERRSELGGIDLQLERAIDLIEGELRPFIEELEVPETGPAAPGEFFLRNENYESVDAELLYAILRARKPSRVLELGSGFTTLLIGQAARRNAEDGIATEHLAYDPFPRARILGEEPPPPTRFEPLSATEVPLEDFRRLEAGDVLFVDTTHTVKLGSDVNYIVLDVLPALAPGVIVHFHDVFLPWEYPRVWFEKMQYYWAEQYLLQAFLAFNSAFEVLIPAQAVARDYQHRLAAVIDSFSADTRPGAFWLVRS